MRIKTLIFTAALALGAMSAAYATDAQQDLGQLQAETKALRLQLAELRQQVTTIQEVNASAPKTAHHQHHHKHKHYSTQMPKSADQAAAASLAKAAPMPYMASPNAPMHGSDMDRLIQSYLTNLPLDWDNPGQSFVTIGPYINVPIQFTGNNLIINDPKINTDVALLKLRKAAHEGLIARGIHTEDETHHSHLLLSGNLEGQAQYVQYGQQGGNGSSGNNGSSTNVDLSATELDGFLLSPSPWISGFFSFSYDGSRNPTITNSRVLNSRIYLNDAFIIVGDFNRSPVYSTIGQMYVPFGTYSSVMVSAPLTKAFARTKARAFLVGFQQQCPNAFYASIYAFKGDSHASATSRINNGGVNLGYRFSTAHNFNAELGAGYLANIADAVGMQYTGNQPSFNGFGGPNPYGSEKIVHRVPALDLRGRMSVGEDIDFIAEYVGVTTDFNPNDLAFNNVGARPWGLNTEAAYTFRVLDKPTSLGVGYSQAREALALGLAERRISAVLNTSIWHNTIQSLEFRHDINYSQSSTATGSGVTPLYTGLGTSDNVVTLNFDVYF